MCRTVTPTTTNVPDFQIDLGQFTGWDDNGTPRHWVLRIYDCGTQTVPISAPTRSIGKITVVGDPAGISRLAITVSASSWTDVPTNSLERGCIDFGGLEVSDIDLLAKTRVSIAVSGDTTGVGGSSAPPDLHANQFVRVQVEGRPGPSDTRIGGSITGQVVAEAIALPFGGEDNASIGQVRAWRAIRAKIEAKNYRLSAVRVVGDPAASPPIEGISGDILAENSSIGVI